MKRLLTGLILAAFLFGAAMATPTTVKCQCPPGTYCPRPGSGYEQPGMLGRLVDPILGKSEEQRVKPPSIAVHVLGASGVIAGMAEQEVAILTAYHVVEGHPYTGFNVRLPDGTQCTADIYFRADGSILADKAADIALLKVESKETLDTQCWIADKQPAIGDTVWACGYGPNDVYRAIRGKVLQYTGEGYGGRECGPRDIMVMSGEAQAGDSGGPIFDSDDKLVSIVSRSTRGNPMGPDRTWGASLDAIRELCADTKYPFLWFRARDQVQQEVRDGGPIPAPPPTEYVSVRVEKDVAELRAEVDALTSRLEALEKDAGKPGTEAITKATAAETEAKEAKAKALEAIAKALGIETTVKQVAEEAKAERTGIIRKAIDGAKAVATAPFGWIKWALGGNMLWSLILTVVLAVVALFGRRAVRFVKADLEDYKKTGDPLAVDPFLNWVKRTIPGQVDDFLIDRGREAALNALGYARVKEKK